MRTAFTGTFSLQARRVLVALLVMLGLADVVHAQFTRSVFDIKEIVQGSNATVELAFPFSSFRGVSSLTSPSGEVFNSASILEDRLFSNLIKTFPSLDDAFSFLAGTWQGTFTTHPFGDAEESFEFTVGLIEPDSVYRGVPQDISLEAGDRIRSGKTFLLSWDYPSEHPDQTYLQIIPQFDPIRGGSRMFIATPQPGSSSSFGGSTGIDPTRFEREFRNEPGTSENRFLVSFAASDAALPLNIELTFGAATSLNSAIANPGDDDSIPSNDPPIIGMRYIRTADAFQISLVSVPEPPAKSVAVIATTCMLVFAAWRRKGSDRTGLNWCVAANRL